MKCCAKGKEKQENKKKKIKIKIKQNKTKKNNNKQTEMSTEIKKKMHKKFTISDGFTKEKLGNMLI